MNKYDEQVVSFGTDHTITMDYYRDHGQHESPYVGMDLADILRDCWLRGARLGEASCEALVAGYSVTLRDVRGAYETFDALCAGGEAGVGGCEPTASRTSAA